MQIYYITVKTLSNSVKYLRKEWIFPRLSKSDLRFYVEKVVWQLDISKGCVHQSHGPQDDVSFGTRCLFPDMHSPVHRQGRRLCGVRARGRSVWAWDVGGARTWSTALGTTHYGGHHGPRGLARYLLNKTRGYEYLTSFKEDIGVITPFIHRLVDF